MATQKTRVTPGTPLRKRIGNTSLMRLNHRMRHVPEITLRGISAAAAVEASLRVAAEENGVGREKVIAPVMPESADKYLSERFWEEA